MAGKEWHAALPGSQDFHSANIQFTKQTYKLLNMCQHRIRQRGLGVGGGRVVVVVCLTKWRNE